MCVRKTVLKLEEARRCFLFEKFVALDIFFTFAHLRNKKDMKPLCSNKQMIRFRRWSRKGYAMFCSLGKCVTIGSLKKGIADISLGKQTNICTAFSVCFPLQEDNTGDQWDDGLTPSEYMLQRFWIQPLQLQAAGVDSCLLLHSFIFAERMRNASFRLFLS